MSSRRVRKAEAAVADWNARYPVGTPVRYWTFTRTGEGKPSRTRTEARVIGEMAVVWVNDHGACLALTHVDPLATLARALGHSDRRIVEGAYPPPKRDP